MWKNRQPEQHVDLVGLPEQHVDLVGLPEQHVDLVGLPDSSLAQLTPADLDGAAAVIAEEERRLASDSTESHRLDNTLNAANSGLQAAEGEFRRIASTQADPIVFMDTPSEQRDAAIKRRIDVKAALEVATKNHAAFQPTRDSLAARARHLASQRAAIERARLLAEHRAVAKGLLQIIRDGAVVQARAERLAIMGLSDVGFPKGVFTANRFNLAVLQSLARDHVLRQIHAAYPDLLTAEEAAIAEALMKRHANVSWFAVATEAGIGWQRYPDHSLRPPINSRSGAADFGPR